MFLICHHSEQGYLTSQKLTQKGLLVQYRPKIYSFGVNWENAEITGMKIR